MQVKMVESSLSMQFYLQMGCIMRPYFRGGTRSAGGVLEGTTSRFMLGRSPHTGCIVRLYFRGEGVRRNALRVLRPKSLHSEDYAQYIEWRNISWGPHELRERVGRAEAPYLQIVPPVG